MMPLRWAAALLLAALVAVPAAAQDACEEGSPCRWVVQVDEEGLSAPGGTLEGTAGDWFRFELNNLDPDASHTITWSLDGSSWQVPALDTVETDPFELFQEGTYTLTDQTTGDTMDVTVTLDDVANGDETRDRGGSGPALVAVLAAVGAALWLARRH